MVDSSLVKRGVVLLCSFVMLVVFFTLPFVSRSRQEEEERQDQEESFRPAAGIVWKDDSAAPKRRTKPETSRGYRVSRCWSCPTQVCPRLKLVLRWWANCITPSSYFHMVEGQVPCSEPLFPNGVVLESQSMMCQRLFLQNTTRISKHFFKKGPQPYCIKLFVIYAILWGCTMRCAKSRLFSTTGTEFLGCMMGMGTHTALS